MHVISRDVLVNGVEQGQFPAGKTAFRNVSSRRHPSTFLSLLSLSPFYFSHPFHPLSHHKVGAFPPRRIWGVNELPDLTDKVIFATGALSRYIVKACAHNLAGGNASVRKRNC